MNPPPSPRRNRFPWVWYLLALFLILSFAFAPIGSVMLCAWIANAYGCKVDEGSVHPCIINGHDYGELLYDLGVGLVHARYYSRRTNRICQLADLSHPASCSLAKASLCRSSSSDSLAAITGLSGYDVTVDRRLLRVERPGTVKIMRIHILQLVLVQSVASIALYAQETQAAATAAKPAFVFEGVSYFHRWSMNDQHEFTP